MPSIQQNVYTITLSTNGSGIRVLFLKQVCVCECVCVCVCDWRRMGQRSRRFSAGVPEPFRHQRGWIMCMHPEYDYNDNIGGGELKNAKKPSPSASLGITISHHSRVTIAYATEVKVFCFLFWWSHDEAPQRHNTKALEQNTEPRETLHTCFHSALNRALELCGGVGGWLWTWHMCGGGRGWLVLAVTRGTCMIWWYQIRW